ncbi:aminotransferase class V-fold PLP-dependent enzyme [Nanchangia anserum]|uniref:aminotransferase class V-fold PLP-dependent enzyme n=1 Tax=Nanchangia anserum TaxID=2692125 RepID=UPI0018838AD4|nr:aminotransferase class V-fold PLP-dependent enzyme [Nanchangia anserum]QOX82276.1 aminotransferase class V-fold PLP-dependent enzyme [Nanchangia anserum]
MSLIYLDNAAAAPMRAVAREAMVRTWERAQGTGLNPQSVHAAGRDAAFLLDDARARIALALGADPTEVIFTSGATESDVIALRGAAAAPGTPSHPHRPRSPGDRADGGHDRRRAHHRASPRWRD